MTDWIKKAQKSSIELWRKINPKVAEILERLVEEHGGDVVLGFLYPVVNQQGSIVIAQEYEPNLDDLIDQLLMLDRMITNSGERDVVIGTVYASLSSIFEVFKQEKPSCVLTYSTRKLGLTGMIYSITLFSHKRPMSGIVAFDDAHKYLNNCIDGIDNYFIMQLLLRIDEKESVYIPDPSHKILPEVVPSLSEVLRTVYILGAVNMIFLRDNLFNEVRQILTDVYDIIFSGHPRWLNAEIDAYGWLIRFLEYTVKDRLKKLGKPQDAKITRELLEELGFRGNLDFVLDLLNY